MLNFFSENGVVCECPSPQSLFSRVTTLATGLRVSFSSPSLSRPQALSPLSRQVLSHSGSLGSCLAHSLTVSYSSSSLRSVSSSPTQARRRALCRQSPAAEAGGTSIWSLGWWSFSSSYFGSPGQLPLPSVGPWAGRDRVLERMSVEDLPRKEVNVLKGHEGAVLAARFNADGNYCLSCGKDRTIRLWNPHRGIHIKTYKSHGREVRDVHVTSDNSKLCSCGGDRQIFYWDVATGRVIRKFRGHDGEVNAVKFNEYSSVVVSAGYDQSLRAWDCRSHSTEPMQIIDTFSDSVMSVCLTKTEIIGGSVDGTVRTFDIRIGRETSDNLGQPVNCISMSNDGNCILAGCLDSTLRLLDRSTGELLQEYKGHTNKSFKLDCCLTNTDAHVTAGSEDGYIYFWDLVDASVVSRFRAHNSVVTSVSYHPKENCMVTASVDGTIRVWKT
ncbi:WD repeat domain-containing protein [Arachis hypogaea]|nr:WD repeat domain-containing protein [Arachis hypogaea]